MADQLRQKYTIFKPDVTNKDGRYGSRQDTRLKNMFSNPVTAELIDPAKVLQIAKDKFNPVSYYEGDVGFWTDGKVFRYGLATPNGDTTTVVPGDKGAPGGTHFPNIAAAAGADPANQPAPPQPAPNYNSVANDDYNRYNPKRGVLSPSASSPKVKVTLGQALKLGKSNAT